MISYSPRSRFQNMNWTTSVRWKLHVPWLITLQTSDIISCHSFQLSCSQKINTNYGNEVSTLTIKQSCSLIFLGLSIWISVGFVSVFLFRCLTFLSLKLMHWPWLLLSFKLKSFCFLAGSLVWAFLSWDLGRFAKLRVDWE